MMAARNTVTSFGWLTRALHWGTAALVLAAMPLGLWIARAEISLSDLWLFGLHKSLGISVLVLTALRILWHRRSPPPDPLPAGPLADRLSRLVHRLFYAGLILMPLSGWIASSATGLDTVVFNRVTLPRIAPVSETWENAGFALHGTLGLVLIGLVVLHVVGAVSRAVGARDRTLQRMIGGR